MRVKKIRGQQDGLSGVVLFSGGSTSNEGVLYWTLVKNSCIWVGYQGTYYQLSLRTHLSGQVFLKVFAEDVRGGFYFLFPVACIVYDIFGTTL